MADVRWVDNHIEVAPPKRPLKVTGTRLAAILGANKWNSPFKTWCEITRTYKEPFVDTIYTIAGKKIEPKQAEYMKRSYSMLNLVTPTEQFGEDYFKRMRGDFFPDNPIFGGMYDFLLVDENDIPTTVLEMKTTKRIEDWQFDIPEYYAVQAALYAYLLGIDDVIMVASALGESDYADPDAYVPSIRNTITRSFKLSERYPDFAGMLRDAEQWWDDHVVTGISPDFDEKRDADILKELRTNHPDGKDDVDDLMIEAEKIISEMEVIAADTADKVKRLEQIKKIVKQHLTDNFRDGDTTVTKAVGRYAWTTSKTFGEDVDKDAMKRDGVWEKYSKPKTTIRLTYKKIEEDE